MMSDDDSPLDRVFDALRHPYRRRAVALLRAREPDSEVVVLPETISDDDPPSSVLASLHHRHLPTLAEMGYVEWDRDPLCIRRGWRFDELEPVVEVLSERAERLPGTWPDPDGHGR